jgi:hypothetical protein
VILNDMRAKGPAEKRSTPRNNRAGIRDVLPIARQQGLAKRRAGLLNDVIRVWRAHSDITCEIDVI